MGVESGNYQIYVGTNSAEIFLTGIIAVNGENTPIPYEEGKITPYLTGEIQNVSDEAFAEALGYAVPDGSWGNVFTENDAICQMQNAKSGLARFVFRQLEKRKRKVEEAGKPDLNILFIYNMPFRAIAKMAGGMVEVVNGHFFRGAGQVITGFFLNRKANKKYESLLSGKE